MTTQELKKNIEILEAWRVGKEKQQIKYPLDIKSQRERVSAFNKPKNTSFNLITGGVVVPVRPQLDGVYLYSDLLGLGLGLKWGKGVRFVRAMRGPVYSFTVDAGTDVFTSTHSLQNGDTLILISSGTLPTGVNDSTEYTVTNATATTFKLSGVNVSDTGSGTHYFWVAT